MASLRAFFRETLLPEASSERSVPRIDVLVFSTALAIGAVLVVADIYQRWLAADDIETFNIDGHNNPETWFHSAVLAGAAICALAIAFTVFENRRRWLWLVLGVGIGFFSLDKAVTIHERVGDRLEGWLNLPDDGGRIAWEVAWSPIIVVVAIALIACVWQSNRRTQLWALGLLLAGASKLVMEALTFPAVHLLHATDHGGWFYGLEVNVEESVQLIAFACLFAGFAQLFVDRLSALARGELEVLEQQHAADRLSLPFRGVRGAAANARTSAPTGTRVDTPG
jgi:hypothetical protein